MDKLPTSWVDRFRLRSSYDAVNVFRVILAFSIVWHHCHPPVLFGNMPLNIPGRIGVWLFYVLSGYVISLGFYDGRYQLTRSSIYKFYNNRLTRILPLFIVVYFVCWFISDTNSSFLTWHTLRELFFLQYYFRYEHLDAAWFLGPLIQMYLVFPLLHWIFKAVNAEDNVLKVLIGLCIVTIVLKYVSILLMVSLGLFGPEVSLRYFDDRTIFGNIGVFALGATVPYLYRDWKAFGKNFLTLKNLFWLGAGLILVAVCMYYEFSRLFWVLPMELVIAAAGIFILLGAIELTKANSIPQRFQKVIEAILILNVLSYGIFLWHGVVIEFLPALGKVNYLGFMFYFIQVSVLSCVLAFITYIFIERTAVKLFNH